MTIDQIREQLAEKIGEDMDTWNYVLSDTNPGNYGCDFWESKVDYNNIFVDIPKREFNVKSGYFSAELVMGSSKGESSFNQSYNKEFSAKGKFDFKSAKEITIKEVSINIDTDIY